MAGNEAQSEIHNRVVPEVLETIVKAAGNNPLDAMVMLESIALGIFLFYGPAAAPKGLDILKERVLERIEEGRNNV